MGFDFNGVTCLLMAKASGVSFRKVATIGRQGLHLNAASLAGRLALFGMPKSDTEAQRLLTESQGYAEGLLEALGAEEVTSVDASDYEKATLIHDMNLPLPAELRGAFTLVIDGGSLEHVFNVPQALRNVMEMVAPGGHFLGISPANNLMGHGFYQFSPELFFRVLAPPNGFTIERLMLCEYGPDPRWFEVVDPAQVRRRVTLTNAYPAYVMVLARRTGDVPASLALQQSDYVMRWEDGSETPPSAYHTPGSAPGSVPAPGGAPGMLARLWGAVAWRLPSAIRHVGRPRTRFDPAHFREIDPARKQAS